MPKGRGFAPATGRDGIWFQHIGLPKTIESRATGTTTGLLMSDRSNSKAQALTTVRCPPKYLQKEKKTYNSTNPFSWHDNRNSFQDHGIYFGQGLGKRKQTLMPSQHKSADIITWDGRLNPETLLDINSLYREDFLGDGDTTPPTRRRYPVEYRRPQTGIIGLSTSTTDWVKCKDQIPRTYLQTLANSQVPSLPKNPWKYSYHAQSFSVKRRPTSMHTKRSKAAVPCR